MIGWAMLSLRWCVCMRTRICVYINSYVHMLMCVNMYIWTCGHSGGYVYVCISTCKSVYDYTVLIIFIILIIITLR